MSTVSYVFFGLLVSYYLFFKIKYGKAIWDSAKGKDGELQFVEAAAFMWIVMFPIIIFADLMPEFQPSTDLYLMMNVIFVSAVAGSVTKSIKKPVEKEKIHNLDEIE